VAPFGTVTQMLVGVHHVCTLAVPAFHVITGAGMPAKVTVLDPCELPKPLPVICTAELTIPDRTDRLVIAGGGMAVTKFAVSLIGPFIVTVALDAAPE